MVEIWFGIMGQKCLKYDLFASVDELSDFLCDFVRTWNRYFAHPFNWTYDGKDLHEKAVHRFITYISIENRHMDLGFFSNQIELMLNLLGGYFDCIDTKNWRLLDDAITRKKSFLDNLIANSEKPRIKAKVKKNLLLLIERLKNKITLLVEKTA